MTHAASGKPEVKIESLVAHLQTLRQFLPRNDTDVIKVPPHRLDSCMITRIRFDLDRSNDFKSSHLSNDNKIVLRVHRSINDSYTAPQTKYISHDNLVVSGAKRTLFQWIRLAPIPILNVVFGRIRMKQLQTIIPLALKNISE
jgi:hypothetical protein